MKIKLEAQTIADALYQLGYKCPDITIRFRRAKEDYGRKNATGAVVEFIGETPIEFSTADEAVEYLRHLLSQHDLLVANEKLMSEAECKK